MCCSCGCNEPTNDHGDNRHITTSDLQAAADAAGISVDDAIQNIQTCTQKSGDVSVIRKSFPAVVTKADADTGEVVAFVNSTGVTDFQSDSMEPGCWQEVINLAKSGETEWPSIVWGHDWLSPTGKVTDAEEIPPADPRLPEKIANAGGGALRITGLYNLGTQRGREAFSDVQFGSIREWSVGFMPDQATIKWEKGVRRIGKVLSWPEVSNVLQGASPNTTTAGVKSAATDPKQRRLRVTDRLKQAFEIAATLKETWSAAEINDLPDSAFAFIESGGEKDEDGKTTPRSLRHFPHHDKNGSPDEAHVRNALARIPQSDVSTDAKDKALSHVKSHAKKLGIEVSDDGKSYRVNGEWKSFTDEKATTHSHFHFHPDGEAHSHKHSHSGDVSDHDGPATKVPHAHGHPDSDDGKAADESEVKADGDIPGIPVLADDEAQHYGPLLQALDGIKALIVQECQEDGYAEFDDILCLAYIGQDLIRWARGESSEYGESAMLYSPWDLFSAGLDVLTTRAAEAAQRASQPLQPLVLALTPEDVRQFLSVSDLPAMTPDLPQPTQPNVNDERDGKDRFRHFARRGWFRDV